jgi:hypothetical protein
MPPLHFRSIAKQDSLGRYLERCRIFLTTGGFHLDDMKTFIFSSRIEIYAKESF